MNKMDSHKKSTIVYIAGRFITGKRSTVIYETFQSKYAMVDGTVEEDRVNVYDFQRKCYIDGIKVDGKYQLYDHGEDCQIELEMTGNQFRGYDYGTRCYFNGEAKGDVIYLFDDGVVSTYYCYKLC